MKLTVTAVQCYKTPHYDEYLILPNFLFKSMVVLHNCCVTNPSASALLGVESPDTELHLPE